jgi:hypothetical protein
MPHNTDVAAHAKEPLLALGDRMHFGIPLAPLVLLPPAHSGFALVKVELGALMIVASRIVPSLSITLFSRRL